LAIFCLLSRLLGSNPRPPDYKADPANFAQLSPTIDNKLSACQSV
jgi:hypothetical protein